MASGRKQDIKKEVYDRARRVKQLEDEAKAVSREIEERQARLLEIATEREKELYAIKALEQFLDESERWTQWHRTNKKDGDPLALVTLMAEVLEKNRDGLNARTILTEIRKIGYQTTSRFPQGMVHGSLHRRKDLFFQLKNKTWVLKKYAPDPMENVIQLKAQS